MTRFYIHNYIEGCKLFYSYIHKAYDDLSTYSKETEEFIIKVVSRLYSDYCELIEYIQNPNLDESTIKMIRNSGVLKDSDKIKDVFNTEKFLFLTARAKGSENDPYSNLGITYQSVSLLERFLKSESLVMKNCENFEKLYKKLKCSEEEPVMVCLYASPEVMSRGFGYSREEENRGTYPINYSVKKEDDRTEDTESDVMLCGYCGKPIEEEMSFCRECGCPVNIDAIESDKNGDDTIMGPLYASPEFD